MRRSVYPIGDSALHRVRGGGPIRVGNGKQLDTEVAVFRSMCHYTEAVFANLDGIFNYQCNGVCSTFIANIPLKQPRFALGYWVLSNVLRPLTTQAERDSSRIIPRLNLLPMSQFNNRGEKERRGIALSKFMHTCDTSNWPTRQFSTSSCPVQGDEVISGSGLSDN